MVKGSITVNGADEIGDALAMALGIQGATVVVSSRNQEAIEKVARKITEASGNEAIAIPSDVTDESSVQNLSGSGRRKKWQDRHPGQRPGPEHQTRCLRVPHGRLG